MIALSSLFWLSLALPPALRIDCIGLKSNTAPVYLELLDRKGSVVKREVLVPERNRIELNSVTPGTYALKVFQDLNGNGKLDTGWMGIPKEPYGFSNNAMGRFGPPALDDLWFDIAEGTVIQIQFR